MILIIILILIIVMIIIIVMHYDKKNFIAMNNCHKLLSHMMFTWCSRDRRTTRFVNIKL